MAPGSVVGIDNKPAWLVPARADANVQGVRNASFAVGDIYQLNFPDSTFDVVHAHQVLHVLTEPVTALREMRRVCKPDGVVAARNMDHATAAWYPPDPRIDRLHDLSQRVMIEGRSEPDAGRRLLSWALEAGFNEITCSATCWCFATPEERAWWGDLRAEWVTNPMFADQALERHLATREDLVEMAEGFRWWAKQDDGWFAILHGEVLCRG